MQNGFNLLPPVTFKYEHDESLLFNQNAFSTQQGLTLNLVNALSGCKDEAILNYSNIFLTKQLPINTTITLPPTRVFGVSLPTYLAINGYPTITNNTRYLTLSSTSSVTSPVTVARNLSAVDLSYFGLKDIDGLNCRIYNVKDNQTRCLTVDTYSLSCIFTAETPTIRQQKTNILEYSLDDDGNLKLYYRANPDYFTKKFYAITVIDGALSAVDTSLQNYSITDNVFVTNWSGRLETNLTNDFVYYDYANLKNFFLNLNNTEHDVNQNYLLYYNYLYDRNFNGNTTAYLDFFKGKNVLSDDYNINDKLPFKDSVVQRDYTNILSKQNSEKYAGDLQFNYNYYTKDYLFKSDKITKFTLPTTLYPFSAINVTNSGLIKAGAYGGSSPLFSDKISKDLNENDNVVLNNDANGTYLYTWLYTNSNATTAYWLDRYYFPKKTSLTQAFDGSVNQIFTYNSPLCVYLSQHYSAADFMYYDIRSSFVFEPSATYYYSRIGNKYISKITNSFPIALSAFNIYNSQNALIDTTNSISFDNNYSKFNLKSPSTNSFTISFDYHSLNADAETNLIFGNNFDEGISLYKGGYKNIFTPGYFVNSLTGVNFFNSRDEFLFSINISQYVDGNAKVLDVVNTGFDHLIKLFYLNTSTNIPGFLDIDIRSSVYNKYEFSTLANAFNQNDNIFLYSKFYYSNSEIWYLVKSNSTSRVYKFDYISNTYLGYSSLPTGSDNLFNSFVEYNNTTYTLTGFGGKIFNEHYGVSKLKNVVYFKNLSTNSEFPALCSMGGNVFDFDVFNNRLYVLSNGIIVAYDENKYPVSTYYTDSNVCSGIKLDFINENYKTKLLSYGANLSGSIVIDKFDLDSSVVEKTIDLKLKANPEFFGEFNTPTIARMTTLGGIGNINGAFISGGIANAYTLANPIVGSNPYIYIDAVLGGLTDDCNATSILSGSVGTYTNLPIPTDVYLSLFEGTTEVVRVNANGITKTLDLTYNAVKPNTQYSLVVSRSESDNLVVSMIMNIVNGSFYNGSFRNAVIGSTVTDPNLVSPGFANVFYAYNDTTLIPQNNFLGLAQSYALAPDFTVLPSTVYIPETYINGVKSNPRSQFFVTPTSPNIYILSNPDSTNSTYTSGFSATLLGFDSSIAPTFGKVLSGAPFQSPVNFANINTVNKFDKGDMIFRSDLYSGTNYNSKQTTILPFSAQNDNKIAITVDVINGCINVYTNGILMQSASLSAGVFYSSYYLSNDFGLGVPLINNVIANIIDGLTYLDLPKNYSMDNVTVYNRALNTDEVRMDYLKNKKINDVILNIPQGTRNDTDTVLNYNKLVIPGRKSNSIKLYIKNISLSATDRLKLNQILLDKLITVLPLNTNNVEIEYTDE